MIAMQYSFILPAKAADFTDRPRILTPDPYLYFARLTQWWRSEHDVPAPAAIHPQASERYRAKVAQIHEALTKGDAASREAIAILRDLIDYIEVRPTERPAPVDLRVRGNLAALLVQNTPGTGVAVSMVAGARNSQCSHASGSRSLRRRRGSNVRTAQVSIAGDDPSSREAITCSLARQHRHDGRANDRLV